MPATDQNRILRSLLPNIADGGPRRLLSRKFRIREATFIGDPPVCHRTERHIWGLSLEDAFETLWGLTVDKMNSLVSQRGSVTADELEEVESLIPVVLRQQQRRLTLIAQSDPRRVPVTRMTTLTPWGDLPRFRATPQQASWLPI